MNQIAQIREGFTFEIPGTPVAKMRPRFTRNGYAYTAAPTRAYERHVAETAQLAMLTAKRKTTTAAVSVALSLYFPIPESWSKKKKALALTGEVIPTSVDIDNVAKSILDGCNGVVFNDDGQVVELYVSKRYGAEAKARVFVKEIQ